MAELSYTVKSKHNAIVPSVGEWLPSIVELHWHG